MTKTNLWESLNGKKVPIQMMNDTHLRGAYRLCWMVVYYYQRNKKKTPEEIAINLESTWNILISIEIATKFSLLFEEEIKRRGKKYKRPQYGKLSSYLKQREDSKDYLRQSFRKTIYPQNY